MKLADIFASRPVSIRDKPAKLVPDLAVGIDPAHSGSTWVYGTWSQIHAGLTPAILIAGVIYYLLPAGVATQWQLQIGSGPAASEVVLATLPLNTEATNTAQYYHPIWLPDHLTIRVAGSTRLACRFANNATIGTVQRVKLMYVEM